MRMKKAPLTLPGEKAFKALIALYHSNSFSRVQVFATGKTPNEN
jgi:hypothetical protein